MPEPDWKRYGYSSLEAYIESKAGACPKCGMTGNWHVGHGFDIADYWPMPEPPPYPADDENKETPDAAS